MLSVFDLDGETIHCETIVQRQLGETIGVKKLTPKRSHSGAGKNSSLTQQQQSLAHRYLHQPQLSKIKTGVYIITYSSSEFSLSFPFRALILTKFRYKYYLLTTSALFPFGFKPLLHPFLFPSGFPYIFFVSVRRLHSCIGNAFPNVQTHT